MWTGWWKLVSCIRQLGKAECEYARQYGRGVDLVFGHRPGHWVHDSKVACRLRHHNITRFSCTKRRFCRSLLSVENEPRLPLMAYYPVVPHIFKGLQGKVDSGYEYLERLMPGYVAYPGSWRFDTWAYPTYTGNWRFQTLEYGHRGGKIRHTQGAQVFGGEIPERTRQAFLGYTYGKVLIPRRTRHTRFTRVFVVYVLEERKYGKPDIPGYLEVKYTSVPNILFWSTCIGRV